MCLVDDAQWLDRASAQALAFVARRLLAESVGLGVRGARARRERARRACRSWWSRVCDDADARALLGSALRGPLDERVRDRIVAETRGNPLALLELPRGLTPAELAGGFGLPDALPLSGRIEESFRRRLAPLAGGDAAAVAGRGGRAGRRAGAGVARGRAARDRGRRGGARSCGRPARVRRPGAVPSSAGALGGLPGGVARRSGRSVHRALAEATDPEVDPDRRAWHRAHAAPGPDEDVAAELERSAGRAQARGGLAAAAAFLERAAALTPEPARRARARAGRGAGQAPGRRARRGAGPAGHGRGGTARRAPARPGGPAARPDRVRREPRQRRSAAAAQGRQAARAARRRDWRARPTWTRWPRRCSPAAWPAAAVCWRWREAARAAPPSPQPPRAPDLLLDGWRAADHGGLRRGGADAEAGAARLPQRGHLQGGGAPLALARLPHRLGAVGRRDLARALRPARSSSPAMPARSPSSPSPSTRASVVHLFAGELRRGRGADRGGGGGHRGDGEPPRALRRRGARRLQGREAEASELIEAGIEEVVRRGEGIGLTVIQWASAVLYNGLGRYEDALAAAAAGQRRTREELRRCHLGAARAHRGGRPQRDGRARRRRPRSGSRRRPAPAAPTGRWGSRPARERC